MRWDINNTLPEDYLQKVDLASMAYSLESRVPLLDHHIVEWSQKLPINVKIKLFHSKYILRKVAYKYFPKEITNNH